MVNKEGLFFFKIILCYNTRTKDYAMTDEAADLKQEKALICIAHGKSRESITSGCRGGQ